MGRNISRRAFAQRWIHAARCAAALAAAPSCRSLPPSEAIADGLRRDLTGLGGPLLLDEASRLGAADDFGHLVHRMPAAVLRPGSSEDVVAVIRYANRHGLRVAMNGNGHSAYGQAQARAGLVIQSRGLARIHGIGQGEAHVDAGVTWGDLAKATLAKGLIPPVMTEFQDLTIGGTLSVGGVGPASHHVGAQVDHVRELEVVTGAGEVVRCSGDHNEELFHAVLAGLGQCGLILRARVRLVPAPSHVVVQELAYGDLASYLSDASHALHQGFEHQLGHVVLEAGGRVTFKLKVGRSFSGVTAPDLEAATAGFRFDTASKPLTQTYWAHLNQRAAAGRPSARWYLPHPTLYLFVPATHIERFVTRMLEDPSETAGAHEPTLFGVSPWNPRHFTCPLFQVPRGVDPFFAVHLFRTVSGGDLASASAMVAANRRLYERARGVGGKNYPISALRFDAADWTDHFGPETWRRFSRAKHEFDPRNVLTPGPTIFGSE